MSQSGTPDFQKLTQRRGDNIFNDVNHTYTPGAHASPTVGMTYWDAIYIRATNSTDVGYVQVDWYADVALTIVLDTSYYYFDNFTDCAVVIPARGNFVVVTINNTSGVNITLDRFAAPQQNSPQRLFFPTINNFIMQSNKTLLASAIKTWTLPWIEPGLAYFMFHEHDNAAQISVDIVAIPAPSFVSSFVRGHRTEPAIISETIGLPNAAIVVELTNNDAAASHDYDVALVPGLGID